MLKRISSLKQSTVDVCSEINAHIRDDAPSKGSAKTPSKSDLKPLVVELRLLGGALHSLESLITELSNNGHAPSIDSGADWPLVERCELLITALSASYSVATPEGLRAAKSSLLDNRAQFSFVLGSESLEDITLQFSILGSDTAIPQLVPRRDEEETETVEIPGRSRFGGDAEEDPTPEEVSSWLTVLNTHGREPAEYSREMMLVQSRRMTVPDYRIAATQWPKYAEKYWQKLRPQVCSLFRTQNSFVQWVLEFARETFPRTLGSLALSPRLLIELTDALCNGISPLHVAAALGLPNLCRDLLSMGGDINQSSLLGSPLFCALMGVKVLVTRSEPDSWSSLLVGGDSDVDQAATVLLLLEAGADCSYRYHWHNADGQVSLAGLAFWAAMTTKHETIFTRIVSHGCLLDRNFSQFLQRETLLRRGQLHRTRFARLLTYVYDLTLFGIQSDEEEDYGELQRTVSKLMKHANIKFAFSKDSGKIAALDDARISDVTRDAVLDFDVTLIQRLTHDPRFDPNLPYDKRGLAGTILHMATEGSQFEIMDILIGAGADVRARDANGRTPLMVVEETTALSKLVLEYKAPTSDVDNDGRTIWHLAASSNDVDLLKWLWENDPHKEQNLRTECDSGFTPLKAAFAYVHNLAHVLKSSRQVSPSAARFLLDMSLEHMGISPDNNQELAPLAVEWGNRYLLEKLFEAIPDVNEGDVALPMSLNMSASPELVAMVLRKYQSLPLQFTSGETVAETVITNTRLLPARPSIFPQPTSHPSCFPAMTRSAYQQLLTPEVIRSRDHEGRGIWQRFCFNVLPLLGGPSADHPSNLHFLSAFICMTISCLVENGALSDYETATGEWAILCMAQREGRPSWESWQFPFISAILRASDSPSRFFGSFEAALLLQEATRLRHRDLVEQLIKKGVSIHKPWKEFGNESLLENFLCTDADIGMIRPLLSNTKPEDFIARQTETFDAILHMPDDLLAMEIVGQFVKCGLNPNHLPTETELSMQPPRSILTEAVSQYKAEIASALLERGADPGLSGPDGYNALIAAADTGQVTVLEEIVEKASEDFDWHCIYEEDGITYNALQMAAANGHRDVLQLLLEATPLTEAIDAVTSKNGLSPAHLAAKAGSLDCLKILARFGGDLEAKDASGRTPLFWAVLGTNEEVIEYLKESLLDPEQEEDYGISLLDPLLPAGPKDDLEGEPEAHELVSRPSHGRASKPTRESESRRLGAMIADTISRHRPGRGGLFASLLNHVSKEELESAILPCGGCTLLSYTAACCLVNPMLELLELGFRGLVTGCSKHWPGGYNAILHGCLQIQKLLEFNIFLTPEKLYNFFRKCLDAYLAEGRLWFHLSCPPIYAICHYQHTIGGSTFVHQEKVLRIFIDHLVDHADDYWSLMEKTGLSGLSESTGTNEGTARRLLRFVLNLRSQDHPGVAYLQAIDATALHTLVSTYAKDDALVPESEVFCNMAQMLISNGADVNARDSDLTTPLHLATEFHLLPLLELFLEAGADPNARDSDGVAPLGQAAAAGEVDVVRCLLRYGADPRTFNGLGYFDVGSEVESLPELFSLGLDPYDTTLGDASIASRMLSSNATTRAYALNAPFDFYRLAEREPAFLSSFLVRAACSPIMLQAVLRRIPKELVSDVVNFQPSSSLSPGCYVIKTEDTGLLEQLINFGFDFEREWCDSGSALMFAGTIGAFKCFKTLVLRGARLSYVTTDRYGQEIVRSVVEATRVYPKLLQWLLVGRHHETKLLDAEAHSAPFSATKPWSGPRRAAYRFIGNKSQHARLDDESMADYHRRITFLRKSFEGKVMPVTLLE
ncbi:hypothetical protein FDECE_5228 [Fusarium decemcellulare]|nr:hypothetical protein FDECE_5228 [Fusarium decemcellulare]